MMENIPSASNVSLAHSFGYVFKKEIKSEERFDFVIRRCSFQLGRICEGYGGRQMYGKSL